MAKAQTTPDTRLLTSLQNNPRNPRKISNAALSRLAESLKRFGDLGGVVLNRRTGRLVGGHQRIAAFKLAEVPAHIVEKLKKPDRQGTVAWGWIIIDNARYTYREVDWSEEDEAVANLAANKIAGEWDDAQLRQIISDLAPSTDLDLTGFSAEEVTRLMATDGGEPQRRPEPRVSDDDYSLFELIMQHENKRRFMLVLDTIRTEHDVKTLEEAIMVLVEEHEGANK